mmetsp:Transcript_18387/g.31313  ORF Transcript_18387/g.31313 Transcript_18387/m.31313 type:complete len:89 (-) Transcript_18387:62-328(-)
MVRARRQRYGLRRMLRRSRFVAWARGRDRSVVRHIREDLHRIDISRHDLFRSFVDSTVPTIKPEPAPPCADAESRDASERVLCGVCCL